ncbi:MAG: ferredoxin [Erysipelotrichaceae bacterium]|nr:ferredoxin [Erysipelotrichaceae bacterium]
MVKVKVDADACIGCGLCISTLPEVFQFGDDGKSVVIADADEAKADEVIASCPVGAISKE